MTSKFQANMHIYIIWNWRRASDERGISKQVHSRFNFQLLNMMLEDDVMPWHTQEYDVRSQQVRTW